MLHNELSSVSAPLPFVLTPDEVQCCSGTFICFPIYNQVPQSVRWPHAMYLVTDTSLLKVPVLWMNLQAAMPILVDDE